MSYFTNSGSEATEVAVLSAKEFTGNQRRTQPAEQLPRRYAGRHVADALGTLEVQELPLDWQREARHAGLLLPLPLRTHLPFVRREVRKDVETMIKHETSGAIAAFIGEPMQGVGGVVDAAAGVLPDRLRHRAALRRAVHCRRSANRVRPDRHEVLGLRELGREAGHRDDGEGDRQRAPLAACITRPEIAKMMTNKLHFNTFGGNPVCVTQGLATIDIIDRDGIQQNALAVGAHLKKKLLELAEKQPMIGEVRGMGLMLGVELVKRPRDEGAGECGNDGRAGTGEGAAVCSSARAGCTATCFA